MSTKIEWTDETWNPISGCTRVSAGCDHCYIERTPPFRMAHRKFDGTGPGSSTGVVLHTDRLNQPLHWRKPRRVFVNSLADLFHDDVPDGFIGSVFETMADSPQHTFQVLTKRPARMRSLLNKWAGEAAAHTWAGPGTALFRNRTMGWVGPVAWPLPNVHLGVSVEDQKTADLRIPILLDTPAAVRWISAEPLLGPIDLDGAVDPVHGGRPRLTYWLTGAPGWGEPEPIPGSTLTGRPLTTVRPALDWVVAGGESGPGSRPMHPDWVERLRNQCREACVPFLFKQWGDWGPMAPLRGGVYDFHAAHSLANDGTLYGPDDLAWPDGPRRGEAIRAGHDRAHLTAMYRVGKKAAGRELDGRSHDEYPAAPAVVGVSTHD